MTATISTRWYFSDWMSDPGVRASSLAARGVWIDLLSIAGENKGRDHGFVLIAGRVPKIEELARLLGATPKELESLLDELAHNGVFNRDKRGAIYCRRMVRAQKYRGNGRLGGIAKSLNGKENKKAVGKIGKQRVPEPEPEPEPELKLFREEASPLVNGRAVDQPRPKPKSEAKRETDQALLDRISDQWNAWAQLHGSPQVQRLTGARATACRRRIAELMEHGYTTPQEAFAFLLGKCDTSFFVLGSPRTKLNFDQLMRESFMAKMIEGNFAYQKGARQWAS